MEELSSDLALERRGSSVDRAERDVIDSNMNSKIVIWFTGVHAIFKAVARTNRAEVSRTSRFRSRHVT